jgi:hypothetical protein
LESVFYLSGYAGPQEAGILRIAADFEAGRLEIMQSVRGDPEPFLGAAASPADSSSTR